MVHSVNKAVDPSHASYSHVSRELTLEQFISGGGGNLVFGTGGSTLGAVETPPSALLDVTL